ncbi:hypothetical protein DPMN_153052 [Dreissena polymorpha]|uniref:Uncharacterized protein n=1 Tax=Dreissena polymorpha TaxID=45954 RepID=A0A9D4J7X4_DREPO|nr:hypothetical protein DPMN_153052 [Dreissena polymorpha]
MDSQEKPVQTRIGCGVEVQGQLCCMRSLRTITSKDPSQTMHQYLKNNTKKATGTHLPKIRSFLDHSDLQDHASESCTNKLWTCKGTLLQKILSAKEKPVNEMKSVEHSDHTIDPSRPVNEVTC